MRAFIDGLGTTRNVRISTKYGVSSPTKLMETGWTPDFRSSPGWHKILLPQQNLRDDNILSYCHSRNV